MARIILTLSIIVALSGCAFTHQPRPDAIPALAEPVPYRVCLAGEDEPELVADAIKQLESYGFAPTVKPFPEDKWLPTPEDFREVARHEFDSRYDLIAYSILFQIPPCDLTLYYRTRTGMSAACVMTILGLGMCVGGGAATLHTSGVVIMFIKSEYAQKHEILHALGCEHSDESGDECGEKVMLTRQRIADREL